MTDQSPNPYRFTGDAKEATTPRETSHDASLGAYQRPDGPPILKPSEVRRLVFDRAYFVVAFLIAAGWNLLTGGWTLFLPTVQANPPSPGMLESIGVDPYLAQNGLWGSQMLFFLVAAGFAYRMQEFANRSRFAGLVVSALLFVPLVRYLVAIFLIQDSRQMLFRHGIETQWLRTEPGSLPGPDAP